MGLLNDLLSLCGVSWCEWWELTFSGLLGECLYVLQRAVHGS